MNRVAIGIDGGGTRTRAVAETGGGDRWTGAGGAVNPRIVGIERSSAVIAEMITAAIDWSGGDGPFDLCAGIAGAGTSTMQRALADSIRLDLKHDDRVNLTLTDDATIAYEAAFRGQPGVLIVVGTGSSILVRTPETGFIRWGGWGYLLGDEGSGYSIGRAGMRTVAASIDANEPTALTTRAAADLSVSTRDELLQKVYGSDYSLSAFAPSVLAEADQGDTEAAAIVAKEARTLVNRFAALAKKRAVDVPSDIKVVGGLSNSRTYMTVLADALTDAFAGAAVVKSGSEPVEGALWRAKQMQDG